MIDYGKLGIAIGVVGVGYAIYVSRKMNKICDKIDKSVDDLAKRTDVDIPEALIETAVLKAVDREVGTAVKNASDNAVRVVTGDIRSQVRTAVETKYDDIRVSVSDELAKRVASIDMVKFDKEVKEKAEQKILEKFDGNLDELLTKFNRELDNVTKIYKSISDTITNNNNREKETVLRIS